MLSLQVARDPGDELRSQVLADHIAAEWEREAGFLKPPCAHVGDEVEALVGVRELPFVDEETELRVAGEHRRLDLVEGRGDGNEIGLVEPEREVRRRERPRDRDAAAADIGARHRRASNEARAVAIADRCAMREERVAIGEIGVGVDRDRGHLQLGAAGALIERLDVLQLVDVRQAFGVDGAGRQSIEHERVVRIRAVGQVDDAAGAGRGRGGAWSGRGHSGIPIFFPSAIAASMSLRWRPYSGSALAVSDGAAASSRL